MKKLNKLAAMAALGLMAGAAQGQTTNATFNVSASVAASCTATASDLAFGPYSPFAGAPVDQITTISVTCTNGLLYSVALDGTPAARSMTGPAGSTLNYGMFSEAARSTPFAAGGTGTGVAIVHTVFGRIPAGQTGVRAGSYNDTVNVTVTY